MSKHVFGLKPQRRAFVAAAAAASMLLAISGPVATADKGTGSGTGAKHHTQSGGGVTPGGTSTILHNNSAPNAAAPAAPDPGINFGFHGTGNSNFGNNTDPLG
ncbi:MAG TPA: hypothetical protein VHU62_12475, partial [Mycobacterium sp.]|nr:hypothetical protein [Mycobacterium sp.]